MSDKRLRIYLNDHLALMAAEVAVIRRCRSSNRRTPLADFLERLGTEVLAQKSIAVDVGRRVGAGPGLERMTKQGAAWFAEKLGRLKLNGSIWSYSSLSRLVELEGLSATAQERIALWDNLAAVAKHESRLEGLSFSFFREQSEEHLKELNTRRRFAAVEALGRP